jgi:hypothetical protein
MELKIARYRGKYLVGDFSSDPTDWNAKHWVERFDTLGDALEYVRNFLSPTAFDEVVISAPDAPGGSFGYLARRVGDDNTGQGGAGMTLNGVMDAAWSALRNK